MQEITFTLQTITPLFLAGNNQREIEIPEHRKEQPASSEVEYAWEYAAELRPPSFRGLMRYWLRALIGGLVGANDAEFKHIKETEKAILGTTDVASAVSIRITNVSQLPRKFTETIGKKVGNDYQTTGRGYLLWSMTYSGKGAKYKPHRWYFPEKTTFDLTLSVRGKDSTQLDRAIAMLWLLTNLGGVGSRSRRCAGSLMAQPCRPLAETLSGASFKVVKNVDELKTLLECGIRTIRSLYPQLALQSVNQQPTELPSFDTLSSYACQIWILCDQNVWRTPDIAMDAVGSSLQAYRRQFDEQKARSLLNGPLPRDARRMFQKLKVLKIFGFPGDKIQARRASPLLLRITPLQQGYVCVAVLFKSQINPIPAEYYKVIEDWVSTFAVKVKVEL